MNPCIGLREALPAGPCWSRSVAKALKRAGKPYRYIEQEGGDHHLSQYAHRLEFFKALEAFLDRHLQVRD
jgi:dipeptidyl aminopeptidase/acylaminoacyl peptidase